MREEFINSPSKSEGMLLIRKKEKGVGGRWMSGQKCLSAKPLICPSIGATFLDHDLRMRICAITSSSFRLLQPSCLSKSTISTPYYTRATRLHLAFAPILHRVHTSAQQRRNYWNGKKIITPRTICGNEKIVPVLSQRKHENDSENSAKKQKVHSIVSICR